MVRRWCPVIEQHMFEGPLDRWSTRTDLAAIGSMPLKLNARARLSA